jgi:hypothetical protein
MKFNLVVDIDDQYIAEYLTENSTVSKTELEGQLNNACYLGLDCTNAIIMRQFGMGICDTYVKKSFGNADWGQTWGDNFPTEDQCPIDVIEHHAQANNVIPSDDVIRFARSMWNEGNLTEKLS